MITYTLKVQFYYRKNAEIANRGEEGRDLSDTLPINHGNQ